MTLKEAENNVGKSIIYIPYKDCSQSEKEFGIITSVTDRYVFVKYNGDMGRSKATRAEDINLL